MNVHRVKEDPLTSDVDRSRLFGSQETRIPCCKRSCNFFLISNIWYYSDKAPNGLAISDSVLAPPLWEHWQHLRALNPCQEASVYMDGIHC